MRLRRWPGFSRMGSLNMLIFFQEIPLVGDRSHGRDSPAGESDCVDGDIMPSWAVRM